MVITSSLGKLKVKPNFAELLKKFNIHDRAIIHIGIYIYIYIYI